MDKAASPHIGTLNEKPLHAALKAWYAEDGDRFEVPVAGFVIDIVRGDLLIEIQTGRAGVLRRKLLELLKRGPTRLVLPVMEHKTIINVDESLQEQSRRSSPKRGRLLDAFIQLVSLPELLGDPNFSVDVVLIDTEEVRRPRSSRRTRKGWEVHERRLVRVIDHVTLDHPGDYVSVLPHGLPETFTTADLAHALNRPRRLAQQIAYVLRELGTICAIGRTRAGIRYCCPLRCVSGEQPTDIVET